MTQLYSNLVTYMNNTTYLCPVLAVLSSPVVLRVRLASLYMASLLPHSSSPSITSSCHVQLSKHSPIIDQSRQGRPTHGLKQRVYLLDRSRNFLFYHLW